MTLLFLFMVCHAGVLVCSGLGIRHHLSHASAFQVPMASQQNLSRRPSSAGSCSCNSSFTATRVRGVLAWCPPLSAATMHFGVPLLCPGLRSPHLVLRPQLHSPTAPLDCSVCRQAVHSGPALAVSMEGSQPRTPLQMRSCSSPVLPVHADCI